MMCVGISSFLWYTRQTMIDEFSCEMVGLGCCDGEWLDAKKEQRDSVALFFWRSVA